MYISLMLFGHASYCQQIISSECIGTSEIEIPFDIQSTSDGGFIIAGYTMPVFGIVSPISHGGKDFYVAKLNANGGMDWQYNYGGSQDDIALGVAELPSGEFVVTGTSYSNDGDIVDHVGSNLSSDIWCIRISPEGALLWSKSFGTTGNDLAGCVLYKNPNQIILAGTKWVSDATDEGIPYNSDVWLSVLDLNGNLVDENFYGNEFKQELHDVICTNSNQFYIAGTEYSDQEHPNSGSAFLMKINQFNNQEWSVPLEADISFGIGLSGKICQDSEENIILCYQSSLYNDGFNCNPHGSFLVASISESGNIVQQKCFGGSGTDKGVAACMTADGTIWLVGNTDSTDGDIPPTTFEDTGGNVWLARLDENLNIDYSVTLGGSKVDKVVDINVQDGMKLFILGHSNSTDGNVVGLHDQYGDYHDNWIVRIDTEVMNIQDKKEVQPEIYPIPVESSLTVYNKQDSEVCTAHFFDAVGHVLMSVSLGFGENKISLDHLPSGIYMLQLSDSSGRIRSSGRVVKS
jgi:hypothetical protein